MDMKSAGPKGVLCLSGFPNPAEWQRDVLAEVWPLDAEWKLKLGPVIDETPAVRRRPRWGLERLYRTLDRLLFGRALRRAGDLDICSRLDAVAAAEPGSLHLAFSAQRAAVEAAARGESVLYVEFEGRQMADLEEAVRSRLGVLEATLNAQVWMVDPLQRKRLLFQGQLDMDHRSLCQSIALCAAKLPALLRGALARASHPELPQEAPLPPGARSQRLSAPTQLLRLGQAIARRLLWRGQWQIEAYRCDGGAGATGALSSSIKPPANAFWADPFLLHLEGRVWLLFEELPYATNKGHISIVELDQHGQPKSAPQVVLSEPWHLSYPFVFQQDGVTYMLPEASACRELRLYRCEDPSNPVRWTHCATLLEGQRIADATVIEFEGRLWMFCTHGDEDASMDDTVHIYWAEHITGPWQPHQLNPVKIDAHHARPAGNMWVQDGMLHRVVQNCSTAYGGGAFCTRVRVLNESEFEEEVVRDWSAPGVKSSEPWHTYNRHEQLFVLDRLRRASRWAT
jgi:hypothetical protein